MSWLCGARLHEVLEQAERGAGDSSHVQHELVERANQGKVVILDVRPHEEFAAGHIPGALSVPLDQLDTALTRLPKRAQIVAYCRGPYCVMAPQAVQRRRAKGYRARRLADGMPEWRLAGLPVAVGEEERP